MSAQADLGALRTYVEERNPTVVLDTNIIIHCERKASHFLTDTCALLDVRICDTVYWEFLRNVNLDRFRERRAFLATWHHSDFLREDMILHEDAAVSAMHGRLFLMLLRSYARHPQAVLQFMTPDLWIAAAAVTHRFDHVLTLNDTDFPSALFETVVSIGPADQQAHLLRFKRKAAREAWAELIKEPTINLDVHDALAT